MRNKTTRFNVLLILIVTILVLITFNIQQAIELRKFKEELTNNETLLMEITTERDSLKKEITKLENVITRMTEEEKDGEVSEKKTETSTIELIDIQAETICKQSLTGKPTYTNERDFLAKLLYCEAGGESWECQVYTCSAILNLSDYSDRTIWDMGHDYNTFSVAYIVDDAEPTQTQYDVIDYVLDGGRVPEICFFRTDHYHNFGTPVCQVGAHYFSKP